MRAVAKRVPFTKTKYDLLVEAFRDAPGKILFAATKAGVDRRVAARAWKHGWPSYPWGKPIREVLDDDQMLAMSEASRLAQDARKQSDEDRGRAREYALKARGQELKLCEDARARTVDLLTLLMPDLIASGAKLVARIKQKLEDAETPMALDDVRRLVKDIISMQKASVETAKIVIDIERSRDGDPAKAIRVAADSVSSTSEVGAKIAAAARHLARAKKLGIQVFEGGKGQDEDADLDDDDDEDERIEGLPPVGVGASEQMNDGSAE